MAIEIFLGEPPANIKQWIIEHATPAEHPETRFTLQGGTIETYDITGILDLQWMIANGYYDDNNWEWTKTIVQVDIGNTVTSIGVEAFSSCTSLTSVTIPDSVTIIGLDAFMGCSRLTSVTIPDSVTSIGSSAFNGCDVLMSVTIPNSVTSIEESAFNNCSSLTSVTIPNSVTSIGSEAFYGCSSLTSVTIPDSVTSIGYDVFSNCSNLTSVTITSNGGNAENVKQSMIAAGVSSSITWNMPEPAGHPETRVKYPEDFPEFSDTTFNIIGELT